MIKKGETRHITFTVDKDDLSIVDRNMQRTVEPGDFKVMIGSASNNILLEGTITVK